jgi:hypothetical protein
MFGRSGLNRLGVDTMIIGETLTLFLQQQMDRFILKISGKQSGLTLDQLIAHATYLLYRQRMSTVG